MDNVLIYFCAAETLISPRHKNITPLTLQQVVRSVNNDWKRLLLAWWIL